MNVNGSTWNLFQSHKGFVAMAFCWTFTISFIRVLQHYSLQTNTFDLSVFDYMLYSTSQGELMSEPFHGKWQTHFSIHFMPFLYLLVPLYHLIEKTALALVLIQVLAGLAFLVLVYLTTRTELSRYHISLSLAITAMFALYRPFWSGILYDFHPEMFFPALMLLLHFCLTTRRKHYISFCIFIICLLIKEDVGLYLSGYGAYLAFTRRDLRKQGLSIVGISSIYVLIVVGIVIPHFRTSAGLPNHYLYFDHFNSGDFATTIKYGFYFTARGLVNLLAPFLLIPLSSSAAFLLVMPVFTSAVSGIRLMQSFQLHYVANVLPFIVISNNLWLQKVE